MAIKITGFYQLPHQTMPELVDFNEVFDTSFMRKYTRFRTFEKFLQGSRFKIENQRDFEALPEEKMDAWVRKATKFSSWQEMLDTATDKYVMHKNLRNAFSPLMQTNAEEELLIAPDEKFLFCVI